MSDKRTTLPDRYRLVRSWQRDDGRWSVEVHGETGGICIQTADSAEDALARAIEIVWSWEDDDTEATDASQHHQQDR
jgi:predicted RNase H-like HicB family nuclease